MEVGYTSDMFDRYVRPYVNAESLRAIEYCLLAGYTMLNSGRHRIGFSVDDSWMIKVPRSDAGLLACRDEVETYRRSLDAGHPWHGRLAMCEIIHIDSVECLRMERVSPIVDDQVETAALQLHPWISEIDCCQVGWTRDGRLVAYDYGDEYSRYK